MLFRSVSQSRYRANNQAENAIAARDAWEAGIMDAIARGARERGLAEVGTEGWRRRTLAVGVSRWPQGAKASVDEYQKAVAPFFEVLKGLTLPPRGPKGSPENYERVRVVGEALHRKRIE